MISWKQLLERYFAFSADFDISASPPVTDKALDVFLADARKLQLEIDPAAIDFLTITNGTGFDGLLFYGANIDDEDDDGRLDFIKANELIEERGDDTLYGEWQDEFFVRVHDSGKFVRRSKVTGDIYETYSTYEDLLTAVLTQECNLLEERFGNGDPR